MYEDQARNFLGLDSKIDLSKMERVDAVSTSKGNQEKYYDRLRKRFIKLPFEYKGRLWKDYMVEALSSMVFGEKSVLDIDIVKQNVCQTTDGRMCSVSSDFNAERGTEWCSMERLLKANSLSISDNMFPEQRFKTLVKMCLYEYEIDITDYLVVMIVADYLLLNEDRHLNNFGICRRRDGRFEVAPLFDFGLGLFEHDTIFEGKSLEQAMEFVECKPFAKSHSLQVQMLKNLGYEKKISEVVQSIHDVGRELFPSELAYQAHEMVKRNLRKEFL